VVYYFYYFLSSTLKYYSLIGGGTTYSWGVNFGISIAQDALGVETLRVYVEYVLGANSLRPQLQRIFSVLTAITTKLMFEGSSNDSKEIKACQHLSGSCRAARFTELKDLVGARVLREVDDGDIEECKYRKHESFSLLAFTLISIPATISLFIPDAGTFIIESIIPSVVSSFILLNAELLRASVAAIVIPYVVGTALVVYVFYVYKPAKLRVEGNEANQYTDHKQNVNDFRHRIPVLYTSWFDIVVYTLSPEGLMDWWSQSKLHRLQTDEKWQELNTIFKQTTNSMGTSFQHDTKAESKIEKESTKLDLNSLPLEILDMHKQLENTHETPRFQYQPSILEHPQTSNQLLSVDSIFSRFWITPHITTDYETAYNLMCIRYIHSNSIQNGANLLQNIGQSVKELINKYMPTELDFYTETVLLSDLWQYYYPYGHSLSIEERQEIIFKRIEYRVNLFQKQNDYENNQDINSKDNEIRSGKSHFSDKSYLNSTYLEGLVANDSFKTWLLKQISP
jgi:hypothetical protein